MAITPALTPEEWAGLYHAPNASQRIYGHQTGVQIVNSTLAVDVPQKGLVGLAALCLHGQPFGFTWEDVDVLRGDGWDDIADRIAALLPPREPRKAPEVDGELDNDSMARWSQRQFEKGR